MRLSGSVRASGWVAVGVSVGWVGLRLGVRGGRAIWMRVCLVGRSRGLLFGWTGGVEGEDLRARRLRLFGRLVGLVRCLGGAEGLTGRELRRRIGALVCRSWIRRAGRALWVGQPLRGGLGGGRAGACLPQG